MQEWSPVQVSASTPNLLAHHALAFFLHLAHQGFHAALLVQGAFTLRDDHLGTFFLRRERFLEHCRTSPPSHRCA